MSTSKPTPTSKLAEKELEKVEKQFDAFDNSIKEATMDRIESMAPKAESKELGMSQKEVSASKEIYLKPKRGLSSKEKFNEKYRDDYNYSKEYVNVVCVNNEVVGETLELWTKPFPGVACEEWAIPCNKPVWIPRYLAEQIKRKYYHRLTMDNKPINTDANGVYYGAIAVDSTIQRLDCHPVNQRKSLFTGSGSNF